MRRVHVVSRMSGRTIRKHQARKRDIDVKASRESHHTARNAPRRVEHEGVCEATAGPSRDLNCALTRSRHDAR